MKSLGNRFIHLEDYRAKTIGFPGKKVKKSLVMQVGKKGMHDDEFALSQITGGKYKGLYVFTNEMSLEDVSIFGKTKAHQWLSLESADE